MDRFVRAAIVLLVCAVLGLLSLPQASGQSGPQISYGAPHGELRIVMAYVDFPDSPVSADPPALFRAQVPMVEAWYREVSYGMTTYRIDGVQRWVRIDKPAASYGLNQYSKPSAARQAFIRDVVAAVDSHVDFSQYRAIAIVHPEQGAHLMLLVHGAEVGICSAGVCNEYSDTGWSGR